MMIPHQSKVFCAHYLPCSILVLYRWSRHARGGSRWMKAFLRTRRAFLERFWTQSASPVTRHARAKVTRRTQPFRQCLEGLHGQSSKKAWRYLWRW